MAPAKINILLVDDQPAKLLSYEAILDELGENLLKANSAKQALELLLKLEIAVILIDVCMPDLDGFELARMIRDHPRFKNTAIIFVSAVLLNDVDRLKGYALGAVDYVPVPVIPEVLRAKVRVFAELYRKTRELELLNAQLEQRVSERTIELQQYTRRLIESEKRRSLALAAGQMGSWEWDVARGAWLWDEGQYRIFGVAPQTFSPRTDGILLLIHPDDRDRYRATLEQVSSDTKTTQMEFRVCRPNGQIRWCIGAAASSIQGQGPAKHASGVTVDITDRKEAEEHQKLLAREVDHRARNALAVTQSIINLTRAATLEHYMKAVQGRIAALARTHTILSESRWLGAELSYLLREELSPYTGGDEARISFAGPAVSLRPAMAQSLALVTHELATNAAKYGALAVPRGRVAASWEVTDGRLVLRWVETGGPKCTEPTAQGFGAKMMKATIENQLRGSLSVEWNAAGMRCSFSIPLEDGVISGPVAAPLHAINKRGKRILLVEDESVVALMMADFIGEFGFAVVGPFGKVSDALRAAKDGALDGAVLDINLNGEMVYPVADALLTTNVPFLFVTGYTADSIDARFAAVPVLYKPVERDALRQILLQSVEGESRPLRAIV
jgi:PAS domain S-box-containing protein